VPPSLALSGEEGYDGWSWSRPPYEWSAIDERVRVAQKNSPQFLVRLLARSCRFGTSAFPVSIGVKTGLVRSLRAHFYVRVIRSIQP